jgi:DNA modification methylase
VSGTIHTGDALTVLRTLPDASVQCCVTSPPYWGLRDYGHEGQIGAEDSPAAFVDALVAVFREVRRVLRDDGTLWMNLGDSYAGSRSGPQGVTGEMADRSVAAARCRVRNVTRAASGLQSKDLVGVPWRVAFALQADGWILRSEIIWSKTNPMPESVHDRPTKTHEHVFLLTRSGEYFYDADAIADPVSDTPGAQARRRNFDPSKQNKERALKETGMKGGNDDQRDPYATTRNARTVWSMATRPFPEAHFATFPEELPRRCILAGTRVGDVVLDPFTGSGTTCAVADAHQRAFVGIELNPEYADMARRRVFRDGAPLFSWASK